MKIFRREINHVEKTVGRDVIKEILSADDDELDLAILRIQREIMGELR